MFKIKHTYEFDYPLWYLLYGIRIDFVIENSAECYIKPFDMGLISYIKKDVRNWKKSNLLTFFKTLFIYICLIIL